MKADDKQWFDAYEVQGRQLDQSAANYNPLGMSSEKGCANCRWFIGPGACVLVSGTISPTGISDYWMAPGMVSEVMAESMDMGESAVREPITIAQELVEAMPAVEPVVAMTREQAMAAVAELQAREKSLGTTVKDMITNFINVVRGTDDVGNVIALREVNGRTRFTCIYTNNFKDKEKSIFSAAGHKNYEQWVERTGQYPELWVWHTPGTRLGIADWVGETDGILFSSGLIDEGQELRAYQLAGEKDLAMSHGYLYGDVVDGVINKYRSYEMSVLPRVHAANEATTFQLLGERAMAFTDARKAFLKEKGLYSDAEITQMEQSAAELKDHMQKLGVDMKDTEEAGETELQQLIKGQQSLVEAVTALAKGYGEVQQQVVAADEKATAAQKSLDDAVADTMQAAIAKLPAGQKATEDESNIVEDKGKQIDTGWWEQASASIAAAAGIGGK